MNRLDGFVPFLLEKVVYARERGIPKFTIRHPNGDVLQVTMPTNPGGLVEVLRMIRSMGGRDVEGFPFRLVTTEANLRQDVANGLTTQLSESFRG